jgi:iron complex outermembrane receptor protein
MFGSDLKRQNYLNMMPPFNGKLSIDYEKKLHRFDIGGEWAGRQYRFNEGSDFLAPPPGYVILSGNWSYSVSIKGQTIKTSIGINNLLNTRYRSYLNRLRYFTDEQGRQITIRIIIPINKTIHHDKN